MDTNCLFVWQGGRFERLDLRQICYIQSERQGCRVILRCGAFTLNRTLAEMEQRLDMTAAFCRVHDSIIVALHWVESFDFAYVKVTGSVLPLGKAYMLPFFARVKRLPDNEFVERQKGGPQPGRKGRKKRELE
jgi:hypothetical protein